MMKKKLTHAKRPHLRGPLIAGITWILVIFFASGAYAATAKEIDLNTDAALERFRGEVAGAERFLKSAEGVLVFPGVVEAGLVVGGEYGEGALRVDGKTVEYYNIAAGSVGLQIGAQKKDVILVFLEDEALEKFRYSSGWEVGVDGSVVLIDVGAEGSIDTTKANAPIVGFVVGQKGLMANASIEGAKFTKLEK